MLDLLFVYGTLRSGHENPYARLLRAEADLVCRATVPGSIYRVKHYPAWQPEPAGEVHGEVFRLRNPDMTLRVLDEYEGEEFERVIVSGYWLYRYLPDPPANSRIPSGDFPAR